MIRIGVHGALGRMGSTVVQVAAGMPGIILKAVFERPDHSKLGELVDGLVLVKPSEPVFRRLHVVIDFTEPEATRRSAELARKTGCRLVIGTTGLGASHLKAIRRAARRTAIVLSPNMSVGANLLFDLAQEAARRLDDSYDIEIVEAHHRLKKDAPSGTAKRLAQRIAEAKKWDFEKVAVYGRKGMTGVRPLKEIGIHVIRAGDIVGDHTALFSGRGERIEISHHVFSREAFARGALLAARFIVRKKTGLYDMRDVLR